MIISCEEEGIKNEDEIDESISKMREGPHTRMDHE